MTKYTTVQKKETPRKIRQVHPVWRAIGCAFMILIPVVSGALGKVTIDTGLKNGWIIPYQLLGNPALPDWIYKAPAPINLLSRVGTWTNFYAYAAAAIIYMIVLSGVLGVINAFVYQLAGPPRWGPQDVPPPKIKTKRYIR